jgi:ABC-2 type transport system permease protein
MRAHRIAAVIKRYLLIYKSSSIRLIELFYWPLRDIIMWGLTSMWVSQEQHGGKAQVMLAVLAGIVLWQVALRTSLTSGLSIFEEIISHNLINFISTPLSLSEWLVGVMAVSAILAVFCVIFGVLATWLVYGISIWSLGVILIPVGLLLIIFGWVLGFLAASCIIAWGSKAQPVVGMVTWFLAPFLGIFTPLELLPKWAYVVSRFLPASYIFECIRSVATTGVVMWEKIWLSAGLNAVYLCIVLIIFSYTFESVRSRGLGQIH